MVTLSELKQKKQAPLTSEETKVKISKKRKSLKKFDRNLENSQVQNETSGQELEDLKRVLDQLKEENQLLKSGSSLTKNEEKILNAIRSEKIEQKTEKPILSTSMLRKKYKVSAKYQGESIRGLINKSLIEREKTTFSGNVKTYRWRILN